MAILTVALRKQIILKQTASLKLTVRARLATRPGGRAVSENPRPEPLGPSGLRRPAPPRAGCGGRVGCRNLRIEASPDALPIGLPAAPEGAGSALTETSRGVQWDDASDAQPYPFDIGFDAGLQRRGFTFSCREIAMTQWLQRQTVTDQSQDMELSTIHPAVPNCEMPRIMAQMKVGVAVHNGAT